MIHCFQHLTIINIIAPVKDYTNCCNFLIILLAGNATVTTTTIYYYYFYQQYQLDSSRSTSLIYVATIDLSFQLDVVNNIPFYNLVFSQHLAYHHQRLAGRSCDIVQKNHQKENVAATATKLLLMLLLQVNQQRCYVFFTHLHPTLSNLHRK